jgi:hypothetical protein
MKKSKADPVLTKKNAEAKPYADNEKEGISEPRADNEKQENETPC